MDRRQLGWRPSTGEGRLKITLLSSQPPARAAGQTRGEAVSVVNAVRTAVVLAAGNGDRFKNRTRDSKLLQPLLGQPILLRTLESARRAGVRRATIVLGYQAERVRALAEQGRPRD